MKKNEMFKNIVAIRTAKNNVIHSGTGFFVKANEGKIYGRTDHKTALPLSKNQLRPKLGQSDSVQLAPK